MSRGKKLIRNMIIIAVLLYGMYYFNGYYISKDQCINEIIRALYGDETEKIMEIGNKKSIFAIVTDEERESLSLVGMKKTGFLYCSDSSYVGHEIEKEECFDVTGIAGRNKLLGG